MAMLNNQMVYLEEVLMSQEGSNRKSSHAELLDNRCHVPWLKTRAAFGFGRSYDFWAVGKCRAQVGGNPPRFEDADRC